MNRRDLLLLKFGAVQAILMAVYHLYLPIQFQWRKYLNEGVETINWALFALNNYFSFNLLIVGIMLLFHLVLKKEQRHTIKVLTVVVLLFWIFSAVYQLVEPMPLPNSLSWLGMVLPGIAGANVIVLLIPICTLIKS